MTRKELEVLNRIAYDYVKCGDRMEAASRRITRIGKDIAVVSKKDDQVELRKLRGNRITLDYDYKFNKFKQFDLIEEFQESAPRRIRLPRDKMTYFESFYKRSDEKLGIIRSENNRGSERN